MRLCSAQKKNFTMHCIIVLSNDWIIIIIISEVVAGYSLLLLAITGTMGKRGLFWICLKKQNMFLMSVMNKLNIPHLKRSKLSLYRKNLN